VKVTEGQKNDEGEKKTRDATHVVEQLAARIRTKIVDRAKLEEAKERGKKAGESEGEKAFIRSQRNGQQRQSFRLSEPAKRVDERAVGSPP